MAKKAYSIQCQDPDGVMKYIDDATTKSEAEEIARRYFGLRRDRDAEVFIREEQVILRLKPGQVGFRRER